MAGREEGKGKGQKGLPAPATGFSGAGDVLAGLRIELRMPAVDRTDATELLELGRLLTALESSPRMADAARGIEVSYRTAWGRIVEAERRLGIRLVERVKGHGSRATEAGRALALAVVAFERDAGRAMRGPASRLAEALAAIPAEVPGRALRLAASDDLLLQRCLAGRPASGVRASFVGSAQAIEALVRGHADLAGFHTPAGQGPKLPALTGGRAAFVAGLARREQGLIVAPGNPRRIGTVADLARTGLRFVNRQQGAATRTWLDRLLREQGIAPGEIAGYEVEETSHLAVAASVAAGDADAGFGIRAAALRFGLGFVPIGTETYWLAGDAGLRRDARVRNLIEAVWELARCTEGYLPIDRPARRIAIH